MNKYILVDPASAKKKTSDYTAIWVIGLGSDENYYCLDFYRDRLSLTERTKILFDLHKKWKPLGVAYERYGKDSDIEHIQSEMENRNYRFEITEVGGSLSKNDRIKRLVPKFEQGKVFLPSQNIKTNHEKIAQDLVSVFIEEEYKPFPVSVHDDMLDSFARIFDIPTHWPKADAYNDFHIDTRYVV